MKLLHAFLPTRTSAWCWFSVKGANGRLISTVTEQPWRPMGHLFEAIRRTPTNTTNRTYWQPWAISIPEDERLAPLCGRLRSRSRFPRVNPMYTGTQPDQLCPDCQYKAELRRITPQFLEMVANRDPWHTEVNVYDRRTAIDPVTGL